MNATREPKADLGEDHLKARRTLLIHMRRCLADRDIPVKRLTAIRR